MPKYRLFHHIAVSGRASDARLGGGSGALGVAAAGAGLGLRGGRRLAAGLGVERRLRLRARQPRHRVRGHLRAQLLQLRRDRPLRPADHDEADGDGDGPIEEPSEELDGRRLVLPTEQRAHEHEEAVRLVVAAVGRVEDPLVVPRPLGDRGPGAEEVELLPLVHRLGEEAGGDEEEEGRAEAHEVLHPHPLRALEEDAADDAREDQRCDDGDWQGAHIAGVLEVGDHAHEEDDRL
mmetsp:Transcript_46590/g.107988  ORF Transcript_46590/g.107988 Transcript_46590/m.107988 type:complete len:235 (+) Transcript_46590:188-892(+)